MTSNWSEQLASTGILRCTLDWMASKHKNEIVSAFLLSRVPEKCSKDTHQRFKLGLGDWTESSSEEESEKKTSHWHGKS